MGKAIVEPTGVKRCPVCRNQFFVQWPHLWAYKDGEGNNKKYICSWKCLRALEKQKEEKGMRGRAMLTKEQKEKAVQIALAGVSPLQYLAECGSKNPTAMWASIKEHLEGTDPETFDKLPAKLPNRRKGAETPEDVPEVNNIEDAAKIVNAYFGNVETPEAPKICKPVNYDGFECGSIKSMETGFRYEWSQEYELFCIKAKGDEMTLCLEDMRALSRELPKAARVLGVEL